MAKLLFAMIIIASLPCEFFSEKTRCDNLCHQDQLNNCYYSVLKNVHRYGSVDCCPIVKCYQQVLVVSIMLIWMIQKLNITYNWSNARWAITMWPMSQQYGAISTYWCPLRSVSDFTSKTAIDHGQSSSTTTSCYSLCCLIV